MLAHAKFSSKKSSSDVESINPRAIFLLLLVVGCGVFLWSYYTSRVKSASAASPEVEKTVITRPVDNPVEAEK